MIAYPGLPALHPADVENTKKYVSHSSSESIEKNLNTTNGFIASRRGHSEALFTICEAIARVAAIKA